MMTPQNWATAAVPPPLAPDEVHIWRALQSVEPSTLARLQSVLDPAEKARAERFLFERDRERFIVARGILRELLGAYIVCAPAQIRFDYGPQGKPSLSAADLQGSRIRFNASHSHGLAAFAFALDRELGIDVELIRSDFGGEEIAKRYFSREEIAELKSLPHESRAEAFFLCWTRKEAYIKARGEGLQIPLASFSVSLTPGKPEQLRAADASRWEVRSFQPRENYAGALVAGDKSFSARYFAWRP
jgi:4'-phosphopantetheinyl transferase